MPVVLRRSNPFCWIAISDPTERTRAKWRDPSLYLVTLLAGHVERQAPAAPLRRIRLAGTGPAHPHGPGWLPEHPAPARARVHRPADSDAN